MQREDVCLSLPGSTIKRSPCEITFDSGVAKAGWYAVAIQLEDFNSKSSTTPLSSVPGLYFYVFICS